MFLLSLLTAHTSYLLVAAAMLVAGAGIGLVMQILVVAVLNAAPPRHLGAAASAATFFRTIGSAFGVAIFGTLFNSRVRGELAHRLPTGAGHTLGSGSLLSHDPRQLRLLPPVVHTGFVESVAHALHPVFLLAVPISAAAFGLSLLLLKRGAAATS
jgi:hypothetical protein